jgi:hypothetical protein|tara:strand:+ start:464 stop:880 length:417 start_codon:yes stop_codon:yes gene_type:complete
MSLEETNHIEGEEITLKNIDSFLDKERLHNKTESWVKLDKNVKRQVLHSYAEKYGKEYNMPVKEIKVLKSFFNTCLEKNKLNRTKDVVYNRDTQIISSIPGLFFNKNSKNYTIRANDTKRVSTLKSLAPKKKTTEENI